MTETQRTAIEDYMHAVSECGLSQSAGAGTVARLAKAESTLLAALAEPVQEPCAELIDYILQDDIHNRLTPRVVDIAYSAFMLAKQGKNKDDGGPCDWFNDTKPMVMEQLAKIKKDLASEAPQAQQPAPPADVPMLTDEEIIAAIASAKKVPTTYAGWVRDQRIEYGRAIEQAVRQKAGLS